MTQSADNDQINSTLNQIPDEALLRIATCAKHKNRALDLSNLRLPFIPRELWDLTHVSSLDLSRNCLTSIPLEIKSLTNLGELFLANNRLSTLPAEIGTLSKLITLDLDANQFVSLPIELGNLTNLVNLFLQENRLESIPTQLGQLRSLAMLRLDGNKLASLPSELGKLYNLEKLYLHKNQLISIPRSLRRLYNLTTLGLHDNKLTSIPPELGTLGKLTLISIDNNPLPDAIFLASQRGVSSLRRYLASIAEEAEPLFEAKLLLVGEGAVGKSSLLAALKRQDFQENRETTHGIEIASLAVPHPSRAGTSITLNAWDFGGQPVYRITHQFFYSKRSLYLVLWNARLSAEQCDVEGWLKRIRLRVGEGARVLIVATHSRTGNRVPRIDRSYLERTFGDMIVGFHAVDSAYPETIPPLRKAIAVAAAKLPQMGEPFNPAWKAARDEVVSLGKIEPHVTFQRFKDISKKHRIDDEARGVLADLMHDLGYIVYFSDDDALRNEIVLRPEWLSKAIGYVLEDPQTNRSAGELDHSRLSTIWRDHGNDAFERFPERFHPFFIRLMEKFDVSYRLEDKAHSLVGQLVPTEEPQDLPWTPESRDEDSRPSLQLVCRMDEDPPGIVPWLIVRTHRYACENRWHWQRGMFLRHKGGAEAFVRAADRELVIDVRGSYPSHFMSVLTDSVTYLIDDRWPGLNYTLAVPCPLKDRLGNDCRGRFPLSTLRKRLVDGKTRTDCQQCGEDLEVASLLIGFETAAATNLLGRLDSMSEKLDKIKVGQDEAAARLDERFRSLFKTIASEKAEGPSLFSLIPETRGRWNPKNWGKEAFCLTLWCEYPDGRHPCCPIGSGPSSMNGEYIVKQAGETLRAIAPYASTIASLLRYTLPIAGGFAKFIASDMMGGGDSEKCWASTLELMEKTTKTMLDGDFDAPGKRLDRGLDLARASEGSALRELHSLLLSLDPQRTWGGLRRVRAETGEFLWLCKNHYHEYEPPLPKL